MTLACRMLTALILSGGLVTAAIAENAKPADTKPASEAKQADDPFALADDATEQQAEQQLADLQRRPAASNKREAIVANYRGINRFLGEVLSRDYSPEFREAAAMLRYNVLVLLQQSGDGNAAGDRAKWIASLSEADDEAAKRLSGGLSALDPVLSLTLGDPATAAEWTEAVQPSLTLLDDEVSQFDVNMVAEIAGLLQSHAPNSVAGPAYLAFAKQLKTSDNDEFRAFADLLQTAGNRLTMNGSKLVITGKTLEGDAFDLQKDLAGKVVLVDFWATWCGFCIEAFPELKTVYADYHDAGLEIVGVNIDDNAAIVDAYLEKDPLPWVTIQNLEGEDGTPHPNAARYGVRAIPFVVLVGRDGRVIATDINADNVTERVAAAMAQAE